MHFALISPAVRKATAILLLGLISTVCMGGLSACSGTLPLASSAVLPRELPALPAWAKPVGVARPPDGTDWRVIAKTEQNARKENAGRLACLVRWYGERRAEFAKGKPYTGDGSCPPAR